MKRFDLHSDESDSRIFRRDNYFGRDTEERERRRREWAIQQEREREHERQKRKKIEEYERKRARLLEKMRNEKRSTRSSHGRSRSASPSYRRTGDAVPSTSKTPVASQKLDSPSDLTRLFKGPEGTHINVSHLRHIKVDIHRNVPNPVNSNELQREIVNPQDVMVKRRPDGRALVTMPIDRIVIEVRDAMVTKVAGAKEAEIVETTYTGGTLREIVDHPEDLVTGTKAEIAEIVIGVRSPMIAKHEESIVILDTERGVTTGGIVEIVHTMNHEVDRAERDQGKEECHHRKFIQKFQFLYFTIRIQARLWLVQ